MYKIALKKLLSSPSMLLVDKYSPKNISEILGNADIKAILMSIKGNFPHLLFTGPPGTGKTTVSHILKAGYDSLELNASDDRGIDIIRTKVKNFCQKNTTEKLIILDECDHLTMPAQQALRRLMETSDTKFILICNNISQIIEPIQSRCGVLKFDKIATEDFIQRIREICTAEKISVSETGYKALSNLSNGDMRACLNCLEGVRNIGRIVDDELLYRINGVPSYSKLEMIIEELKLKNIDGAISRFEDIWSYKFEAVDLLDGFFRVGKNQDNYELLKVVGRYHLRASEGLTSKLQFYSLFSDLLKALQ